MAELSEDAVMISIYLETCEFLRPWLDILDDLGFEELDFCELRSDAYPDVEITYAPCPRKDIRRD